MADIIHRIGIKADIAKVYDAVATVHGVANWWTNGTTGSDSLGGTMKMLFLTPEGAELGGFDFQVTTLEKNKTVKWKCVAGPDEWKGTEVTFDLSVQDGQSILTFGHRGWRESNDHMAHCSMKWATFLLSLKAYCETGKGLPSPYDLKIDNWN